MTVSHSSLAYQLTWYAACRSIAASRIACTVCSPKPTSTFWAVPHQGTSSCFPCTFVSVVVEVRRTTLLCANRTAEVSWIHYFHRSDIFGSLWICSTPVQKPDGWLRWTNTAKYAWLFCFVLNKFYSFAQMLIRLDFFLFAHSVEGLFKCSKDETAFRGV